MNSVEDQVRAATRAQASALREVRPLRLPPAPGAAPARRPASRARRWRGWMAPVTAAVAVIAVAVSLVIVRDISNGPVVPPTAPAPAPTVPPRYYVAIPGSAVSWYAYAPLTGKKNAPPNDLVVGDTVNGKQLATMAAPTGTEWAGVTAAADDRTFVAFAEPTAGGPGLAGEWYLVRLTPGAASPVKLTQLPIKPLSDVGAMALSPSGTELAIAVATGQTGEKSLCVYSVATGDLVHHCWSTDTTYNQTVFFLGSYQLGHLYPSLTWVDGDNAIAFPTQSAVPLPHSKQFESRETVRSLNLASKGDSLLADSKVTWSQTTGPKANPACDSYLAVSADGKTVSCTSYTQLVGRNYPWRLAWLTYPTRATPHPGRRPVTDYQFTAHFPAQGNYAPPLWVDPSGSVLLVAWTLDINGRDVTHFGVIRRGKFTALPVPSALSVFPAFTGGIPTAIAW